MFSGPENPKSFISPTRFVKAVRRWQTRLTAALTLIMITAVLSATAPAQNLQPAAAFGFQQTVLAAGIWDFFSFLGFNSPQPDEKTPRKSRPINPAVESKPDGSEETQKGANLPPPNLVNCTGATGITRTVGTAAYPTIQSAISASSSSVQDIVSIPAGTFTEQLDIRRCVTLQGAGEGVTIIKSPLTLNTNVGLNSASIIQIGNGAKAVIKNLTVQGTVPMNGCNPPTNYGIFVVEDSKLTMTDVTVDSIRSPNPAYYGCQNGIAIRAGSAFYNETGTLDLTGVTVSNYQKTGIIVSNAGSDLKLKNSLVKGFGAQADIGQNGIQVGDLATATITNNRIEGNVCNAPASGTDPGCGFSTYYSYGIIVFDSGDYTASGNTFTNNDGGIFSDTNPPSNITATATITGNTFNKTRYAGIDVWEGTAVISNNFINGGAFDGTTNGPKVGVSVTSYTTSPPPNVDPSTGNTSATLTSNSISGATLAGVLMDDYDTGDTLKPSAAAHFNRFADNNTATLTSLSSAPLGVPGIKNTTTNPISAENNFWGCNSTPDGTTSGCDYADGNITATPWLKLNHTAAHDADLNNTEKATITTSLRYNSDDNDTSASGHLPNAIPSVGGNLNSPDGIQVSFSVNDYGSMTGTPATLVDGEIPAAAAVKFTAGSVDGGDKTAIVSSRLDNAQDSVNINVNDTIAPKIISITRIDSDNTTDSPLHLKVTFSEAVTGVDAADFDLAKTGTASADALTNADVSSNAGGDVYTVTINNIMGSGTLGLSLNAAVSIADTASNPLDTSGSFTNEVYTVKLEPQTITFNTLGGKTYGDDNFEVSAASNSNLTVSFEASPSTVCTVSDKTVHIVAVGSCTITAKQAGNGNYSAATDVPQSFTIAQKSLSPSFTAASRAYDGGTTASAALVTPIPGVVGADVVTVTGATATFDTKNIGTGKTVTVTGYSLSGADSGNYTLSGASATALADITGKTLTAAFTAADKDYDGTTSATPTLSSLTGVIGSETVTVTGATATFDTKDVGTGKTVTVTGYTLAGADKDNYTVNPTATTTAKITKLAASVTPNANGKVYGASEPSLTGVLAGFLAGDGITATYSRTSGEAAGGLYTISAVLSPAAALGNYDITYYTAPFTITKAPQTITFGTIPTKFYGDADFDLLTATPATTPPYATPFASSGKPLTFTAVGSPFANTCTVTGSTVHIAGAGSCTITASQTGDGNYNAATPVPQTFTITTITAPPVTLDITDLPSHVTKATLAASGPVTVSVPVTVSDVTSRGFTAFDFTVSYDKNQLTPTASPVVLAAADPVHSIPADVAYSFGSANVNGNVTSAGSLAVQGSGAYPLTGGGRLLSLEFTASSIGCSTVTFGSPSSFYFNNGIYPTPVTTGKVCIAEDTTTTVTFGGTSSYTGVPHTATATVTGLSGFSQLVPVVYPLGTDCTNVTVANGCTATASFAGDDTHKASSGNASITITKAPLTVTAKDKSRAFGVANPAFDAFITGYVNSQDFGVTSGVSGSPACTTTATSSSPVSSSPYAITCSAGTLSSSNYSFSFVDGKLVVMQAGSTTSFTSTAPATLAFDATYMPTATTDGDGALTIDVSGSCSITAGVVKITSGSGVCTITATTADGSNFTGSSATQTINAKKATATISLSNLSPTYDGTPKSATATTNPVGLADVSITYDGSATAPTAAGSYAVAASLDNLNYTADATGTLVIAQATQTINFTDPADTTYGALPFTLTANGGSSGNTVTFAASPSTVCTVSGSTVTIKGAGTCSLTASQAGNDNYKAAADVTQTVTIAKAPLKVTATDKSRAFGVANPAFDATIADFVYGQTLATSDVTGTAACDTAATPSSPVVNSPYAITCDTGTLSSSNYSFSFVDGKLTVTTANQTISFTLGFMTKPIDSTDFPVSATSSGSEKPVTFATTTSSVCTVSSTGTVHIVTYGVCNITASQASSDNYNAASDVSQSFKVVPYTADLNVSLPAAPVSLYHGQALSVPVSISETGLSAINTITFDLSYDSSKWNTAPPATFVDGAAFGGTVTTTVSGGVVHVTISSGSSSSYLSGAGAVNLHFVSSNTGDNTAFTLSDFVYSSNTPTLHTGGATFSNNPLLVSVSNGDIKGKVSSFYNGIAIPGVTLNAAGLPVVTAVTDSFGIYDLLGFGDGSYTVTPSKPSETSDSADVNGSIRSRDVTYIQRYRVGLPPNPDDPTSFWTDQMKAAADVDQNGSVQSFDASLIQQFRAGIPNVVNQTGVWKFAVSPVPPPPSSGPTPPIPSSRTYTNVFLPQMGQNYTALLLGDVDGSLNFPASLAASSRTKAAPIEMGTRENAEVAVPNATTASVAVALPTDNIYTGTVSFNAPISVGDVTGQGITSYDIKVLYDPAVITPVGVNPVDTSGTLSSSMSVLGNVVSPGKLVISGSGINPINGSGALLKLVFKPVGNAGTFSNLNFSQFIFNNGVPTTTLSNGQIQIIGPSAASASISGRLLTARGQGISSAQVVLTDTRGRKQTTVSGSFGNYRFSGLAAGETYIITVNSKRYTFTAQAVGVTGDLAAVNLIANP